MESPNIVKMDSKGRILIPVNFRDRLGAVEGTEMIIVPEEEGKELKILPITKGSTAEVRLHLYDSLSGLSLIADALSANSFNIIASESRRVGNGLAEWRLLVDLSSRNNGVEMLKDMITGIDGVKTIEVLRK